MTTTTTTTTTVTTTVPTTAPTAPVTTRPPRPTTSTPSAPETQILAGPLVVSRGATTLGLSCAARTCVGGVVVTFARHVVHRVGSHRRVRIAVVRLAARSYRIAAGPHRYLTLRLDAAGRAMLARSRTHSLVVTVTVTVHGGVTRTDRVRLR